MQKDAFTNQILTFPVGGGHKLHVVDWGNKKAKTPIIYLHGGPGSGSSDKKKAVFDPLKHRVIFFDQRGAGKSTPQGSLKNNTTEDLIKDISKIADKFGFDDFYLYGSSWGSALSLAYSLAHPERVKGIVIGAIYTSSRFENDWVDQGHVRMFYPDAWEQYLERTPEEFRDNPTAYHFNKALNGTKKESKLSAFAYDSFSSDILRLDDRPRPYDFEKYDPVRGMIVCIYYLANNCFLPERYILDNAHKLTMPVWIVQGRYDMVCPPVTAYELHNKLPNSKLYFTIGGHDSVEHEAENVYRAIFAEL